MNMLMPEKKQIVMSLAVIVLAAVFVVGQYLPTSRKAAALANANAAMLAETTASATRIKSLSSLKENIGKLKEEVGDYDAKLPAGRSHGQFLQLLASVMKQQGLDELSVQPEKEQAIGNLSRIPIAIKCNGKLVQIFNFFKAVESFERVIQINEVTMTASDKLDGTVTMQAKANIFYRER